MDFSSIPSQVIAGLLVLSIASVFKLIFVKSESNRKQENSTSQTEGKDNVQPVFDAAVEHTEQPSAKLSDYFKSFIFRLVKLVIALFIAFWAAIGLAVYLSSEYFTDEMYGTHVSANEGVILGIVGFLTFVLVFWLIPLKIFRK